MPGPFPVIRQVDGDAWTVVEEFRRETFTLGTIVVPVGSGTDGASRPFWSKWLISRWGLHSAAAVIHDALYRGVAVRPDGSPIECSRRAADGAFREIMKADGVSAWKRFVLYRAVRLGGGGAWQGS